VGLDGEEKRENMEDDIDMLALVTPNITKLTIMSMEQKRWPVKIS
jgi:hypothetical protein